MALAPRPVPGPQVGEMARAAVLLAAERGWFVHPLTYNAKTPSSPHGQKDATDDPAQINRLWQSQTMCNIGVNTEMSGLLVVDLDVHTEGIDGVATWEQLTQQYPTPETLTVRTASGGVHLYFRMPDPMIANSASKVWPGIDVRGNGYVVAPGSRVNGMAYDIIKDLPVADLPQWFIEAYRPKARVVIDLGAEHASEQQVVERVQQLADELETAAEGTGNDTANRVAFMAGGYVGAGQITEHHVISILLDAVSGWHWANPADFKTMCNTIERAVADGSQNPRPWVTAPFGEGSDMDTDEADLGEAPEPPVVSGTWAQIAEALKHFGVDIAEPAAGDEFTDSRQAEAFSRWVLKYKDGQPRYLYSKVLGWVKWNGQIWADVPDDEVVKQVRIWTAKQTDRAVKWAATLLQQAIDDAGNDPANAQDIISNAHALGEGRIKAWRGRQAVVRLQAVHTLSKGIVLTLKADSLFDSNPDIINTPSGVVDLQTGVLHEHNPRYYCRKITEADYQPGYTHPDWDKAIEAVPVEALAWFHRYIGSSVSGHPNRDAKMVLLHGGGGNGKTLVTGSIMGALGGYSVAVSDRALMGDSGVHPTELMEFMGARLAVLEETQESQFLDTQRLKKIVGTPTITARKIAKDSVTFKTSHSLMINTNHLPQVKESDRGTWRRLLAFPFPYTYREAHEPLETHLDRYGESGLENRLRGGDQQKAIMSWLVSGAVAWYANAMEVGEPPAAVVEYTREWRAANDVVMGFLDAEVVHLVPGAHVLTSDLLTAVNAYLEERGHRPWNAKTLAGRLETHELLKGKVGTRRIKAGSGPAQALSLHPREANQRFGIGIPSWATTAPTTGQYTAWEGLAFRPLAAVAQSDPFGAPGFTGTGR